MNYDGAGCIPPAVTAAALHLRAVHETPATESQLSRLAGLEQALDYLEHLRFTRRSWTGLRRSRCSRRFSQTSFSTLEAFRFTGDVLAMDEGTPFFPNEPSLRVTAPLAEASSSKTALLAIINFQTTIASRAVRLVHAASGRPLMEFGARRAHGLDAALYAARAAHLAGCTSTSFVEAGRQFGIPLSGTMAHSWILAAENERQAFTDFADLFGPADGPAAGHVRRCGCSA